MLYLLFTETRANLADLVLRYFTGATLLPGNGLWQGGREDSTVILIMDAAADALQNVIHLAGDIRSTNGQASVLVAWSKIGLFDVNVVGRLVSSFDASTDDVGFRLVA